MKKATITFETDLFLKEEIKKYVSMNPKSGEFWGTGCLYLPGGSSRSLSYFPPFSPYVVRGSGCKVYDMDGNERIDFFCNASSLILGHAHPAVIRAVQNQLAKGTAYSFPTEHEVEIAKILCERTPSVERVRFCNSGTEATMFACRSARAFTGKNKIAKMEGAYHGTHDFATVSVNPILSDAGDPLRPNSVPDTLGLPSWITKEMVVLPYNNLDAVESIVGENKQDLAGIMVEPVMGNGYIPSNEGFLNGLREITKQHKMLLIFDEVQSFRLAPGGAQQLYGVTPDITVLGKIIGGGFPVGAFGGKAEIMSLYDESPGKAGKTMAHSGTFNANPITTVAGAATLRELRTDVYDRLSSQGAKMRRLIGDLCDKHGIKAQVTGQGSLLAIHFTDHPVIDYRGVLMSDRKMKRRMFYFFMNRGLYIDKRARIALSVPIGDREIGSFMNVLEDFLKAVKK